MLVTSTPEPTYEAAVVRLDGQLDYDTRQALDTELARLLAAGTRRIVIDLSKLTFCDSTGLSTLLLAHRQCVAEGGYLRLAGPSEVLIGVLRAVGLLGTLPLFDTVPEALAHSG